MNPKHRFFAKDYLPPPKKEKKNSVLQDNFDGLFNGIGDAVHNKFKNQKKATKHTHNALIKHGSVAKEAKN